jgi:hypothetical protein
MLEKVVPQQLLERKGLFLSTLVAFILVGSGLAYNINDSREAMKKDAGDVAGVATTTVAAGDRDSDNDGLPDWEEVVYGTDRNNPDSDGDGVLDGDEVRVGRNPMKAGPDDEFAVLDSPDFATSGDDALGIKKEFFAQYLKDQSSDIQEATFRSLVKRFDPKEFQPKYNLVDLKIISDNSREEYRAYANEFGKLITKYISAATYHNEIWILQNALPKSDKELLKELQLPAIGYRNFSNDLLRLNVPSDLAKWHLEIINGYDVMSRSIFAMIFTVDNPVRGTGAYEAYIAHTLFVMEGYAGMVNSIHKKGVVFDLAEPGHYFYWRGDDDTSTSTNSGV